MSAIHEHRLVVRPDDIDALGHANNLVYLRWMLDAALAHSALVGWSQADHLRLGSGWVVRSHRIRYLRPALVGQEIIVRTWVALTKRVTSLRRYQILRADDLARLAAAETDWAYVRFDTGQPTRIPPEVAAAFEIVELDAGLDP